MPFTFERLPLHILDSFPANTALLDAAGRIVLVNRAWRCFAEANGLADPRAGVGANYLAVCDRAAADESVAAMAAAGIRAVLRDRQEFGLDYPCHAPRQPRWFTLRARPVELEGGTWVVVTHEDITDRRLAELALRESAARLQQALAAGGMGTWERDLGTGKGTWSRTEYDLFGVDPTSFTPSFEALLARIHPEDRERVRRTIEAVTAGLAGPEFASDYRVLLPDGRVRWLGGTGRLLCDAAGRPERFLGVNFDITERKERELALEAAQARLAGQAALLESKNRELEAARRAAEEASAAKSRFLAGMSHEIRTPLNAVLSFAELLCHEGLPERQRSYVEAIRTSGRHLLALINDVLDFSRLEADRLELEAIDFRVGDVLEEVRALLASQAVEQGLRLDLAPCDRAAGIVRGDPTRLKQVLINLMGNALKFTPEGGVTLRVRAAPLDGRRLCFRFEVEDTGIGIPEPLQARLFQPFHQAEAATARRYGGSGLGLAISKRLVEAMAGTIGVLSTPGRGSLFWFELPLEPGDAAPGAGRAVFDPMAVPPLRVLVAEDVALNQDLMREMLGRYGHAVTVAADGVAAVALVAERPFDLVLMDLRMPVMGGIEAVRRIRRLPPPAGRLPVIGLTAMATGADHHHCMAAGMDRVLTKPVVWAELFAAMLAVVSERATAPAPAPEGDEAPLLDRATIALLGEGMEPETLRGFLEQAVAEAGRLHAELPGLLDRPQEARRVAHRLRGTAGSFGLARLREVAGAIEELILWSDAAGLVARLGETVASTREELRSFLPRPRREASAAGAESALEPGPR